MAKVPNLEIIDINLDEKFISLMENHNNEDIGYIRRSKGTLKQSLPGTCAWDVTCKGYYPQVNRIISSSVAISEHRVLTENDVFKFQQQQTEESVDEVAEKLKGSKPAEDKKPVIELVITDHGKKENGTHEENNTILEINYFRRVRKSKGERNCKTVNIEMVAGYRGQDPVDELVKYIANGDKSYGNKDKENKTKIPKEKGKNTNAGKKKSKKCRPKSTAINSRKHEKDKGGIIAVVKKNISENENKNWNESNKKLKRQQLKKTLNIFKNGDKKDVYEFHFTPDEISSNASLVKVSKIFVTYLKNNKCGCIEIGTLPDDEKLNEQKPVPKLPFTNQMHVEHATRIMNDWNNLLDSGNYTIIRE